MLDTTRSWWHADAGEVHSRVLQYVASVESVQSEIYERFLRLASLYDPLDRNAVRAAGGLWAGPDGQVSENLCASGVDTVAGLIASQQTRPRLMTDEGDWSTQRRAKDLERYAEGLLKLLDVHPTTQRAFRDAAIKGTGLVKVTHDKHRIRVERVMVDEIIVDEGECVSGQAPRQVHHRKIVDREVLAAKWPDKEDELSRAQARGGPGSQRLWADYRPVEHNEVVVIESWILPIGEPDTDGHQAGRHTICVDGADLEDEVYEKPYFPFARLVWSERVTGWYGIGLIERGAGHQRCLNKLNWQIDRQLDQHAVPTTFVRPVDAKLTVQSTNRAGSIVVIKGDMPQTVIPPAVSGETYRRREDIKASFYEDAGISRLQATAMKPAGLDSGAAMREYKDATTQRFALQEQAYERFVLDTVWLILGAAKEMGRSAPDVAVMRRRARRRLKWADVDMGEVRVQLSAASQLARTPAGRVAFAAELVERGLITADEYRRVLLHPDVEGVLSLYVAAFENVERCVEQILEGEQLVPEPYQNLAMIVWRGQHHYLQAQDDDAPEEILEALRTYVVQAAYMLTSGATAQGSLAGPAPVATPSAPALAPSAAQAPTNPGTPAPMLAPPM